MTTSHEMKRRVGEILASPMGCAFFADARERGYLPEDLAKPAVSLQLASVAVDVVERWRADHETVVAKMPELAPILHPLAEATLDHGGTAWWYEPPDLDRQVWIAHDGETPEPAEWRQPNSPPTQWERYAQKPLGRQYTSTQYGDHSSLLIGYEYHSGDLWPQSWPLQCWLMRMPADVKNLRGSRTGGLASPVRRISGTRFRRRPAGSRLGRGVGRLGRCASEPGRAVEL